MPALADTTVRLLGQEPLAGRMPTSEQLRLAQILDGAGFAYLEVSGGGCFDSAVRRGVESPWERIRALKARVEDSARPGAARPLPRRLASGRRRLRPPLHRLRGRERHRRLPAARPAQRRVEPARGGGRGRQGRRRVRGRPRLQPGSHRRDRALDGAGEASCRISAPSRVLLHDPTGSLQPHRAQRARHACCARRPGSGRHLLPGLRRQRARRRARGRSARAPT